MTDISINIAATINSLLTYCEITNETIRPEGISLHLWKILVEQVGLEDRGVEDMIWKGQFHEAIKEIKLSFVEGVKNGLIEVDLSRFNQYN